MDEDEESIKDKPIEDVFALTEVPTAASLQDYITPEVSHQAYDDTLYRITLSSTNKVEVNIRIMLEKYQKKLEPLIPILFNDVHSFCFGQDTFNFTIKNLDIWKSVYNFIYESTRSHIFFDKFMELLPYCLSHTVLFVYSHINEAIQEENKQFNRQNKLILIPARADITLRVVYIFMTIKPLRSFVENLMNRLFGEDDVKHPDPPHEEEEEHVLLPKEDTQHFDEYAPRSSHIRSRLSLHGTSHAMTSTRSTSTLGHTITFLYPPYDDDSNYAKTTENSGARSYITAALNRDVASNLRDVLHDIAIKQAKLARHSQIEQMNIKTKKEAVLNSNQKNMNIFIDQMNDNQRHGIYHEDPAITLELTSLQESNNQKKNSSFSAPPVRGRKALDQFVDHILVNSEAKVRREQIEETTLTPEVRFEAIQYLTKRTRTKDDEKAAGESIADKKAFEKMSK
ncbi:hypothetical protein TVAG_214590 [Trichomonas vaginalis G3]|uniref:Uncharacterized protein n=1 Tax=Trichomonas vaginalis (strain ATCC PRA-98 / G3) TaxID=412133 RepID=A2DK63_TRIV3|nr:hypothetical protein TVAGG3_0170090 [Trichomonas vaginalis G3]EAY19234.1 hypothetical protein TVAG_214590 [Trichomonas vaginalis G3]KAI5548511.1 hypothetical protein TVAGG3_0170090 [Trichomonas vaginalis G3]|eukprot:XP_001580220.1 hypothetical protein [Trichomonas vaginalis G3]